MRYEVVFSNGATGFYDHATITGYGTLTVGLWGSGTPGVPGPRIHLSPLAWRELHEIPEEQGR